MGKKVAMIWSRMMVNFVKAIKLCNDCLLLLDAE